MNMLKKLASRKLWAAISGVVIALYAAFGNVELNLEKTMALISAIGTLVSYIIGQGAVDASKAANEQPELPQTHPPPQTQEEYDDLYEMAPTFPRTEDLADNEVEIDVGHYKMEEIIADWKRLKALERRYIQWHT